MQAANSNDDFWYRQLFELRIRRSFGDAFQLLVADIYSYSEPDFQPITPWGNWGDGGNDGWLPTAGHYLQMYGPRASTPPDPLGALRKALADFHKLPSKWKHVRSFSFVLNDHFAGIPAPIAAALHDLQIARNLEAARAVGGRALEAMFMKLPDDQRQLIVGGVPSTTLSFIDPTAMGTLLSALADQAMAAPRLPPIGQAPQFVEKIAFNGLRQPISLYLQINSYQSHVVDDFLSARDQGLKQAIAQQIHALYTKSKQEIPSDADDAPGARYVWLTEQLIPDIARAHPHSLRAYREAAQIVLAKYFESCDVFESPN